MNTIRQSIESILCGVSPNRISGTQEGGPSDPGAAPHVTKFGAIRKPACSSSSKTQLSTSNQPFCTQPTTIPVTSPRVHLDVWPLSTPALHTYAVTPWKNLESATLLRQRHRHHVDGAPHLPLPASLPNRSPGREGNPSGEELSPSHQTPSNRPSLLDFARRPETTGPGEEDGDSCCESDPSPECVPRRECQAQLVRGHSDRKPRCIDQPRSSD